MRSNLGRSKLLEVTDLYCVECQQWMFKQKTGIEVMIAEDHVVRGDLYVCAGCDRKILSDFGKPYRSTGASPSGEHSRVEKRALERRSSQHGGDEILGHSSLRW